MSASTSPAPPAAQGFFPLDEALGLSSSHLSPFLVETVTQLGAWMPFGHVPELLGRLMNVSISTETARRVTEAVGAHYAAWEAREAERLEREAPSAPPGPAVLQVSADGAMILLTTGDWVEVKTMATGKVTGPGGATERWSYFSRLADASTFTRLATVDLHRRGVERADTVVAVMDGAEWLQSFMDHHRSDAVRILDFAHAVAHLAEAAQAAFGVGTERSAAWIAEQAQTLKHGDPDVVLRALEALPVRQGRDPEEAERVRDRVVRYLRKRREQIAYAAFLEKGYPIGSGSVESGNKVVVEVRLKGAGMRWSPAGAESVLALRGVVCSRRWREAWPVMAPGPRLRRPVQSCSPATEETPDAKPAPQPAGTAPAPRTKTIVDGRPSPAHPWRRMSLNGRSQEAGAKL